MLAKKPRYRNKKLLQASKDRPCRRCNTDNGTTVRAHYQGIGSLRLGKGMGQKPHDFASTDLCDKCHEYFDTYQQPNDYMRGWEFLMLCMESLEQDFREGIIK